LFRQSLFVCFVVAVLTSTESAAATLRVCASGCQFASVQGAIDAAAPGDTILLRAGETFAGNIILRRKTGTQWITIRSDGSDAQLPAEGVRLVPAGKPGGNTPLTLLPRLVGMGGTLKTTPVIRTEAGAHHYVLKFLRVDGSANLGFETLITLGDDTAGTPASDIVVDRIYAHGHPAKGMKRGITLNGVRTEVLNSYISDIKAVNSDSQAIAGYNGAGPFKIINNYLEGAAENILFGGSDPAVSNLVPSSIEIRRNHLFKPLAWRNPILATPGSPTAAPSSTAGALPAGTHYFRIVAVMFTDNASALSLPSTAVSATTGANGAVRLTWSAVTGADRYRIYRGSSATSQSVYLESPDGATSFTYKGASQKSGAPPTAGTKWVVKNHFELKNAQNVVFDGNLLENVWPAGQYGYSIVLTPRNQGGDAPWVRVRDVSVTNNIIRDAAGVFQLSGYDANATSQQTQRITFRNNLFYRIDPSAWGAGSAKAYLIGEAPADVVLDYNTLIHTNSSIVYAYGTRVMTGFVYTNNISKHNTYGIMGEGGRPGTYSIDKYFPGSTIRNNVLAGGSASAYPQPNAFPTVAQWDGSFANLAGGDYRLLSSSPFYSAGAGGSVPGANLGTVYAAVGAQPTDPTSPPPTDPPPPSPPPPPPPPPGPGNTAPTADHGGPYTTNLGSLTTVDGSGSTDPEGNIVLHRWVWGDEIIYNASSLLNAKVVGTRWVRVQASGAAGGAAYHNKNLNQAKITSAAAAPASYVEFQFYAAAGVPYRMWFRMRAEADAYTNDSMFVQFDRSVNAQGQAVRRIGTTSGSSVILEEGSGAGVAGWGWNDAHYGGLSEPIYFATPGVQTIRIQQREDGIMWDQFVLSAGRFFQARPGETRMDDTVVPASTAWTDEIVATRRYPARGTYPLLLAVVDGGGLSSVAVTTVTIR
jgi:hypothetical protein